MSRLVWGAAGQRFYEAGTDRGVLFVDNLGVVWNGLKSVTEAPSGGSPKPLYIDGIKYLNLAEAEEFQATLEAFSSPAEFALCDGEMSVYAGLSVTQQPRKSFGLSYRTRVGNDIDDLDYGYKIHIVYNALAAPAQRDRTTLGSTSDPLSLSWSITTTPPIVDGFRPTAHLVIDSRTSPPQALSALEDILYGTNETVSRLPSIQEVIDIFTAPVTRRNLFAPPSFEKPYSSGIGILPGESNILISTSSTEHHGVGLYSLSIETPGTHAEEGVTIVLSQDLVENTPVSFAFWIKAPTGASLKIRVGRYGDILLNIAFTQSIIGTGSWERVVIEDLDYVYDSGVTFQNWLLAMVTTENTNQAVNFFIDEVIWDLTPTIGDYFDGNSPDQDGYIYEWIGEIDNSASVERSWNTS